MAVTDRVRAIIVEQLGVEEEVTLDSTLIDDLGADDRFWAALVMAVEDAFGLEIADDDAERWVTVRDMVDYVTAHAGQET
jgi:acyl carrier protein